MIIMITAGIMGGTNVKAKAKTSRIIAWICLRWSEKRHNIIPNGGLMVIYHGRKQNNHLKQIQDCVQHAVFNPSKHLDLSVPSPHP